MKRVLKYLLLAGAIAGLFLITVFRYQEIDTERTDTGPPASTVTLRPTDSAGSAGQRDFLKDSYDDSSPQAEDTTTMTPPADIPEGQTNGGQEPDEPFEPYGLGLATEALEWESTSGRYAGSGNYKNDRILTVDCGNDVTLYVGTEQSGLDNAIYLDFHCLAGGEPVHAGYYLSAARGRLEYSRGFIGGIDEEENDGYSNFALVDRLYNRAKGIEFRNGLDYGVRWVDEYMGDTVLSNACLSVRAIDLDTGWPICFGDLVISKDSDGQYILAEMENADVADTGELDDATRTNLIEAAEAFLTDTLSVEPLNEIADAADGDSEEIQESQAPKNVIVDKVSRPYFNRLLNPQGKTANFLSDFHDCTDTFAVTVPLQAGGLATVYFAPWNEIHHIKAEFTGTGELQRLEPYAYDPLFPGSEDTLLAPHDGYWDKYLRNYDKGGLYAAIDS